jgi:hypothetical protein
MTYIAHTPSVSDDNARVSYDHAIQQRTSFLQSCYPAMYVLARLVLHRPEVVLTTAACIPLCIDPRTHVPKRLPMLEGIVLFAHLLGFFCVMIPLWVLAPKVPLWEVFGAPESGN